MINPVAIGRNLKDIYLKYLDTGIPLREKCYIDELDDGSYKITCAGMTDRCKTDDDGNPLVTIDNFKEGLKIDRKLMFKHVKNGVILEETTFEIKAMPEQMKKLDK